MSDKPMTEEHLLIDDANGCYSNRDDVLYAIVEAGKVLDAQRITVNKWGVVADPNFASLSWFDPPAFRKFLHILVLQGVIS